MSHLVTLAIYIQLIFSERVCVFLHSKSFIYFIFYLYIFVIFLLQNIAATSLANLPAYRRYIIFVVCCPIKCCLFAQYVQIGKINLRDSLTNLCKYYMHYKHITPNRVFATTPVCLSLSRDHSVYGTNQCEMVLRCNAISHWLGQYGEWSLLTYKTMHSQHHPVTFVICILNIIPSSAEKYFIKGTNKVLTSLLKGLWRVSCKYINQNSLRPSDAIWRHRSGQHWLR